MLQNFVLFISFRKTYIYIFSIIDFYSRDMTVIKERCLEIKCNILVQKLVGQWNEMVTSRRAHTHTHTHTHTYIHIPIAHLFFLKENIDARLLGLDSISTYRYMM